MVNNPLLTLEGSPKQAFPVPSKAGNLITLVDRCWVCDRLFMDYGGNDSTLVQEFHHPVPQSFGGSSGPTISICSGHHTAVHNISLRLKSGKEYKDLLDKTSSYLINPRLVHLANIIVRTMSEFGKDPNRRVPIPFSLPYHVNDKLKLLARSRRLNVHDLLTSIVMNELAREFPTRRSSK